MGPRPGGGAGSLLLPCCVTHLNLALTKFSADRGFLILVQIQGHGVNAIAQAGGLWTVFKDMTEVGVALAALYFHAAHSVAAIVVGFDEFFLGWSGKAGPAAAGIKFGFRAKQWLTTTHASVRAGRSGGFVLARVGRLSAFLPGHKVLIRRELLLPLGVRLIDFFLGHGFPLAF